MNSDKTTPGNPRGKADLARRRFLGTAAAAVGGLAVAPGVLLYDLAHARPTDEAVTDKVRWGMLIDTNLCQEDCNACVTACNEEHGLQGFERQATDLRRQLARLDSQSHGQAQDHGADVKKVGDYSLIVRQLNDVPAKDLKPLVDDLKTQIGSGIVVVTSIMEGKVSLVIGVTSDLTEQISAIDLVRVGAEAIGGKGGGGRPDLAQAGGANTDVSAAVAAIEGLLTTGQA